MRFPIRKQWIIKGLLIFLGYVTFLNIYNLSSKRCTPNDDQCLQPENVLNNPQAARNLPWSDKRVHDHVHLDNDDGTVRGGGQLVNELFDVQGRFHFPPYSEKTSGILPIFPDDTTDKDDDRIWNQMRYVPRQIAQSRGNKSSEESPPKRPSNKLILLFNGLGSHQQGRTMFASCPVSECTVTGDRAMALNADVIMWQHVVQRPFHKRPPKQVWALYFLESPMHTQWHFNIESEVNWTATYRHDSTIVAPYYKFTPYNVSVARIWRQWASQPNWYKNGPPPFLPKPSRNYAKGKTKKVAWFVSNCGASNGRLNYASKLGEFIQVDIFGACGHLTCPRFNNNACFQMLNKGYKFYLSFENSNCRDYITEKFFLNGLSNDVLPIVMGAHPSDYARQAPPYSFIHVDLFDSPQELAEYLHYLDTNDDAYSQYFAWKGSGLVDTNAFFWCRLCTMAHEADSRTCNVPHVNTWWNGNGVCRKERWLPGPGSHWWVK